jgi:hypothetical protein
MPMIRSGAKYHGVPTMLLPCGAPAPLKESLELRCALPRPVRRTRPSCWMRMDVGLMSR